MTIEDTVKGAELIKKRIDHYKHAPEVQAAMEIKMVELINDMKSKYKLVEIAAQYEHWYCQRKGIEHL